MTNIEWSNDAIVVSVANGELTVHKVGNATIIAKAGGKQATCAVTVTPTTIAVTDDIICCIHVISGLLLGLLFPQKPQ